MIPRYEDLPEDFWDGFCLIYSRVRGEFYPDDTYFPEEDLSLLELVHTEPVYAPKLDLSFFEDVLPESGNDIEEFLLTVIEEFNDKLEGVIISWSPLDLRIQLTSDNKGLKNEST